jgi:hypothetical protein
MQRAPSLQSLSYAQDLELLGRWTGTSLSSVLLEFRSELQTLSTQVEPGLQSVSNTQAKTGVAPRERMKATIKLRIAIPLLQLRSTHHASTCPNFGGPRSVA